MLQWRVMRTLAQHGTRALLLLCTLAACSEARRAQDASSSEGGRGSSQPSSGTSATAGNSGSASHAAGSGSATTTCEPEPCPEGAPWNYEKCACVQEDRDPDICTRDSDCTLVGRGCCHCPPATPQTTIAVHRDRAHEVIAAECPAGQPMCHCPTHPFEPLAPILHAACVEHRCTAVDLRSLELSACTSDSDCVAEGLGCCGATSDQLDDYVAVNQNADDGILQCFPVPSCNPRATTPKIPATICAADGHCALRKPEKQHSIPSTTCYSPDQNVDHAFDDGATGCDCTRNAPGVCRQDSQGRYVGFICDSGETWQAVNDGPCGNKP